MKTIFIRTFERTLRPVSIALACIIGFCGAEIVENVIAVQEMETYVGRLNEACLSQHLVVFFAFGGLFLMNFCIFNASGIIANEVHEGTFRLLVAKPNSRTEILLAKVAAVFSASYLLYVLILAIYFGIIALNKVADGNIVNGMFAYVPGYLLYGLLITFIFVGLSTLLSCIFKRKIVALLPMLLIMVAILGFFPIFRIVTTLALSEMTESVSLYDLNYHFSLIFNMCVETCGKINGTSNELELTNMLTNLFKVVAQDSDVSRKVGGNQLIGINDYLNSRLVLLMYLIVSSGCYVGSFAIIRKKDV